MFTDLPVEFPFPDQWLLRNIDKTTSWSWIIVCLYKWVALREEVFGIFVDLQCDQMFSLWLNILIRKAVGLSLWLLHYVPEENSDFVKVNHCLPHKPKYSKPGDVIIKYLFLSLVSYPFLVNDILWDRNKQNEFNLYQNYDNRLWKFNQSKQNNQMLIFLVRVTYSRGVVFIG